MNSLFALVIVLGVLVFVHEFGHFIVARLCGVGVEKFSLGFGPRVFGKKVGMTDYRVSAIPLGGYVKMVGEEPDADIPDELIPLSFTHKSLWKRFLIVAAGPVFNLLLPIVIFFILNLTVGVFILKPTVGEVRPDSPAMHSGIKAGDEIIAIDGTAVDSWTHMAELISTSNGRAISVTVRRKGAGRITYDIRPSRITDKNIFGEEVQRYVIGISPAGDAFKQHFGLVGSLTQGVAQTGRIIKLTVLSVVKMIEGKISARNLGGPVAIARMAGQQAEHGIVSLISFIAMLSINLAILNFLPIPVLDGGHLFFFLIEAIIRRPVSIRTRELAQQAGIFLLILLMVLVFYNDIMNQITGWTPMGG
ncbi:MAG: RIP metalloprotease RseP [Deltaproteobacteria bacterium]|nr:MAG: RIP metalloprotease RseP [Deltaproteobacteria bacterium]